MRFIWLFLHLSTGQNIEYLRPRSCEGIRDMFNRINAASSSRPYHPFARLKMKEHRPINENSCRRGLKNPHAGSPQAIVLATPNEIDREPIAIAEQLSGTRHATASSCLKWSVTKTDAWQVERDIPLGK